MQAMRIHVNDLRVDCKIGVWTHERNTTQQIRVDLMVEFDAQAAARSDALEHTLNYADLAREASFILEAGEFLLLESAAWMICRWILLSPRPGQARPPVQSVDVKLTKFGALPGSTLASVQQTMKVAEVDYEEIHGPWGSGELVGETDRLLVSRQVLSTIDEPQDGQRPNQGSCLILEGALHRDGGDPLGVGRRLSKQTGDRPALRPADGESATTLLVVEPKGGISY